MKNKIICFVIAIVALIQTTVYADVGDPNFGGGGSDYGTGSNNNGWAVKAPNGTYIYDADGIRAYLVNVYSGAPVGKIVDLTIYNVAQTHMVNGNKGTKYDYLKGKSLTFIDEYYKINANTNPTRLPKIIYDGANKTSRINSIKSWFLNPDYAAWLSGQLGVTFSDFVKNPLHILLNRSCHFGAS